MEKIKNKMEKGSSEKMGAEKKARYEFGPKRELASDLFLKPTSPAAS